MFNRQPKGTPVGGQFAEGRRPEGGDLASTQPSSGFIPNITRDLSDAHPLGTTSATYGTLVRAFGEPHFTDDDDGRREWCLITPGNEAVVISSGSGVDDGLPTTRLEWNIRGYDPLVFDEVKSAIIGAGSKMSGRTFDFGNGHEPAHQHTNGGGWVADTAFVEPTAFVGPDAKVCDRAEVTGGARISGHSIIADHAVVTSNALIVDSIVQDHALVGGDAKVVNGCTVRDRAIVEGFAMMAGGVDVYGFAKVRDYASVFDHATVGDETEVTGCARVHGLQAHLYGSVNVGGFQDVNISG